MSNARGKHTLKARGDGEEHSRVSNARCKRTLKARGDGEEHSRVSNARCKRSSTKPGATPQVHNHQTIVALQAQKKCKPSAMSLLRWPRRSLLSIKVAVGVTLGNNANGDHYTNKQSHGHGNACWGNAYGYFCAYSAHCPRRGHTWGVAPGFILLRLQRALPAELSYNS